MEKAPPISPAGPCESVAYPRVSAGLLRPGLAAAIAARLHHLLSLLDFVFRDEAVAIGIEALEDLLGVLLELPAGGALGELHELFARDLTVLVGVGLLHQFGQHHPAAFAAAGFLAGLIIRRSAGRGQQCQHS